MAASVSELTTVCSISDSPSAERSFSKLKLIKTYLRSTMAQDRLDEVDGLSLLAIERDAAQQLDIDSIIEKFANTKARVAKFNKNSFHQKLRSDM